MGINVNFSEEEYRYTKGALIKSLEYWEDKIIKTDTKSDDIEHYKNIANITANCLIKLQKSNNEISADKIWLGNHFFETELVDSQGNYKDKLLNSSSIKAKYKDTYNDLYNIVSTFTYDKKTIGSWNDIWHIEKGFGDCEFLVKYKSIDLLMFMKNGDIVSIDNQKAVEDNIDNNNVVNIIIKQTNQNKKYKSYNYDFTIKEYKNNNSSKGR